jgi:hypothetical protein
VLTRNVRVPSPLHWAPKAGRHGKEVKMAKMNDWRLVQTQRVERDKKVKAMGLAI